MGSRTLDGHRVEENLARFAGTFSVDTDDADQLVADQTIVAVVVARLSGCAARIMPKTGVVRRTDVLDVTQFAVVKESELQKLLVEYFPQLETPATALDSIPIISRDERIEEEEPQWIPPIEKDSELAPVAAEYSTDREPTVTTVEPEEEEIFSPGGVPGAQRVQVGGSRRNDRMLARFLDGADDR